MIRLADLSYKLKIPLAITAVIIATELVVAAALVTRAFRDARLDLESSARNLAAVIGRSLREPMVRDDLWQAFEVIRTPLVVREETNPLEAIVILDAQDRIFVATDPQRFSLNTPGAVLPEWLAGMARATRNDSGFRLSFEREGETHHAGAAGAVLSEDGKYLGTVLLSYDTALFYERIRSALAGLALLSVPGMLILIPLGWIWGKRMAEPLSRLATAIGRAGKEESETVAASLPAAGKDEIGRVAASARSMLDDLARTRALEREMVLSERLAAVGQIAAGIAHEINNPLGGMLNALDTLETHGSPDALTRRTVGLVTRGLQQIQATVNALLVEARLDSRSLSSHDWQDLHTLVAPQAAARGVTLVWSIEVARTVPMPAHLVRQLTLNLLLNAVRAAQDGGVVELKASDQSGELTVTVTNTGMPIPQELLLGSLFQPFATVSETQGKRSHGIGLWVCYQIARQLGGSIEGSSSAGWTRFLVRLPFDATGAAKETASEVAAA